MEIKHIVESVAVRGDFSVLMRLDDKAGYALELAESLNQLSRVTEAGLKDVLRVASVLAKGDLTQIIEHDYPGTFGEVETCMNDTVANLKVLVGQIKESTQTIHTASREIAAGNSDLSHRTEEQATSLQETAGRMKLLTDTVRLNTQNARQANQLAIGASGIAIKGGEVVSEVVDTMSSISASSKKISDIISLIDGIAFQTNILALNAAVEAARAGEQGRGFAVVASEVRNLAQRSALAANEIKKLINDSADKVAAGADMALKAGQTMDEVVNSVKRVTDIMAEINAASVEQSAGIEQVNQAIIQMDDVTKQNAALVEEAAAAAESLEEQSRQLTSMMSTFKLDQHEVSEQLALAGPKKFSFANAINAHTKWKVRLIDFIKGKSSEQFEVANVSCDDQCELGQWLYSEAVSYGRLPEYKKLITSHAAFHRSVGDIVQCVHDHRHNEAMGKLGGEFFQLSNQTVRAIKLLQDKIG